MKKILIVDNDKNITQTIEATLKTNKKYKTKIIMSGKEALEDMKNNAYDLILLDLMMPEVSGIDVCKKMVKDKDLKKVPVIIVSALPVSSPSFQKSQDKFNELDVVRDVLEKPFEIDDLLSKAKNVLGE
ncbi:response regulator [bacterium]|nr:response regulator [bacterium]